MEHRYSPPGPGGLAEGALMAFVVGIGIGLGVLYWGMSSHGPTQTANTPPAPTDTSATIGQGNPEIEKTPPGGAEPQAAPGPTRAKASKTPDAG